MNNYGILLIGLVFMNFVCFAETGLVTNLIGKKVKSGDVEKMLSPMLEMSRSEICYDKDGSKLSSTNNVYRTSKEWLKIVSKRYEVDEVVGIYMKPELLPDEASLDPNLTLPFRYNQISSSTTLLSYCALPEVLFYRSDKPVYYSVLVRSSCIRIFVDQKKGNNIFEVGITGARVGDFRDIPENSKYRDQIKYLGTPLPTPSFANLELESESLCRSPLFSVTNIIGSLLIDRKIKLVQGDLQNFRLRRKIVFCDYDSVGAITSSTQFAEYAISSDWLKVVSMKSGDEPERVIQVSVDVIGYKKEGLSFLALPAPLSTYCSPNASAGEIWMECPNRYEYEVCAKKSGCPTWMSYGIRDDGVFELKALFFSQGKILSRYSRYSSYLLRSEYKMMPFFILPGAHENGGMKNWE